MKKCKGCGFENANANLACENCGMEFKDIRLIDRVFQIILMLLFIFAIFNISNVLVENGDEFTIGRVKESNGKWIKVEYIANSKKYNVDYKIPILTPKKSSFIKIGYLKDMARRSYPVIKSKNIIILNLNIIMLFVAFILLKRNFDKYAKAFPFEEKFTPKLQKIFATGIFCVGNLIIFIYPIVKLNSDTFFLYSKYKEYNLAKKSIEEFQKADISDAKNKTALMIASESGNIEFVKTIFQYGGKVNKVDRSNKTALNYAIKSNSPEILKLLLSKGEKVRRKNNHVFLIDDIEELSLRTTELLIEAGITSKDVDKTGNNLLHKSVKSGNNEVINYIVSKGYDIEEKNKTRETPLWIAVKNKNKTAVINLIEKGADIHKTNNKGESVFYNAVKSGDMEILQIMAKKGKISDYYKKNLGRKLISLSIKNENYEVTEFLLENRYKIEKAEKYTILSDLMSREKDKNKVVELSERLLDNGALVDGKTAYELIEASKGKLTGKLLKILAKNQDMKASFFVYCIQKNDTEIINEIANEFKDVINIKVDGYASIHYAYMRNNIKVAEYLINSGVDKDIKDENEKTLLMYAIENNHQSQINSMFATLKAEESYNEDLNGYSVLSYALRVKNKTFAEKIINLRKESGIKKDTTNDSIFAIYMSENEIAQDLMNADFDNKREMSYIETPLVKAIKLKNIEAVQMLIRNMDVIIEKDRNGTNIVRLYLNNFRDKSVMSVNVLSSLIKKIDKLEYKDAYSILARYKENLLNNVITKLGTINYRDKDGMTFLMTASIMGDLDLIKILIANNIDVSLKNNSEGNFIDIAVAYNEKDIISYMWDYFIEKNVKKDNQDYLKLFTWICQTDNTVLLNKVLDENFDYSLKDKDGNTPLILAVKNNAYKSTELLLKNKSVINEKNTLGETTLIIALKESNLELAKLLITAGADVKSVDDEGNTVLLASMELDNQEFVIELIEKGADVNLVNSYGQNVLLKSIEKQNIEIINYLMDKNINFDTKDYDGNSAVDYASKVNNPDLLVKMLEKISYGNFKNNGNDILGYAIKIKNHKIAEKLISKGAKADVKYRSGKIGLIEAIKNENEDIAKLLIYSGADINLQSNYKEVAIIEAYRRKMYDMVSLMLGKGGKTEVKDGRGITLFDEVKKSRSFNEKNTKIIKEMLVSGYKLSKNEVLDILERSKTEQMIDFLVNNKMIKIDDSIFDFASKSGNLVISDYLIKHNSSYITPLFFYSVKNNNKTLYENLLSKNSDIVNDTYNGQNILHIAAQVDNLEFLKTIYKKLKYQFNNDISDNNGWSPLMYAFYYENYEIADYLLEKDANINKKSKRDRVIIVVDSKTNKSIKKSENYHNSFDILIRKNGLSDYKKYRDYFREQDFNIRDWNGQTTIFKIALNALNQKENRKNQADEMLYLLENGAITTIEDNRGRDLRDIIYKLPNNYSVRTAFIDWDTTRKKEQLIALFERADTDELIQWLETGDNITYRDNNGQNLLMYAIDIKNSQLINYLIGKKIDLNYADNYGDTALMYAAANNYYDVAEKLLLNNTDPNIKNNIGNKAIDVAKFRKMRDLLRKHGSK